MVKNKNSTDFANKRSLLHGLERKLTITQVISGLTMLIWVTECIIKNQIPFKAPVMKKWRESRAARDNILSTDEKMALLKCKSDYHSDGLYSIATEVKKNK